jgi:SSS family transporter
MNVYLIALIIYCILMLVIGFLSSKKVKTADDFLLAGRSLGSLLVIGTLLASWNGAGSIVGAVRLAYEGGVGFWWFCGDLVGIVLVVFVASKIRRTLQYTTPDILELRYHWVARLMGCVVAFLAYASIAGEQMIAGGKLLLKIAGVDLTLGILIFAIILIVYVLAGGFFAVAYTDLLQGLLMLFGMTSAVVAGLWAIGGFASIHQSLPPSHFQPFGVFDHLTALSFFAVTFFLLISDQSMWQRFYASRDDRTATVSAKVWLPLNIYVYVLVFLTGLIASVLYVDIDPEVASFTLVMGVMPPILGAIVIASFVGIVMSTADTYLLSASTNVVRDLYQRFINPKASSGQIKTLSRLVFLGLGIVALVLALYFRSVLELAIFAYTLYGGSMAVPLLAAIFWRRANATGGIASVACGFGMAIVWEFILSEPFGLDPILPTITASLIAMVVGSLLTAPPPPEKWKVFR